MELCGTVPLQNGTNISFIRFQFFLSLCTYDCVYRLHGTESKFEIITLYCLQILVFVQSFIYSYETLSESK